MKICYIAHPISGDIAGNLERIRKIVRDINLSAVDVVPFAPYWLDCHALNDNDPAERSRGIQNDIAILRSGMVDEMWLYGDRISSGMQHEVELAMELGIPIKCCTYETTVEFENKYI